MFDPSSTAGVDDVAPAIQLCNHILADAVKTKASDVHIEPSASGAIIRYRRFGILEPVLTLPAEAVRAVINRFDTSTQERFARALDRPDGLVLVTGPTGSGKTTTLYLVKPFEPDVLLSRVRAGLERVSQVAA